MAVSKETDVGIRAEHGSFAVGKIVFRENGPLMALGVLALRQLFGETLLVFGRICDEVQMERFFAVAKEALQGESRIAE